jgi:hypothetical protein
MKHLSATLLAFAALVAAVAAQIAPFEGVSARSHSGQFIVFGVPDTGITWRAPEIATNTGLISLEPTLLAISCERVKQAVTRELGLAVPWHGKIFLSLRRAVTADDPITVVSERFRDGWAYRVELPDAISRERFVRAMVEVLLMEIANRNAGARAAKIPAWLSAGLSQQFLSSNELELILPPPRFALHGMTVSAAVISARRVNPLTQAHEQLMARPPLTFDELSWPSEEQVSGAEAGVFRCNAQLFVDQLLRLRDGPACVRKMIEALPRYYNWQLAFLEAFQPHFQRPLDVEKWWALQLVQFTGRDLSQAWTFEESWSRLDQILRAPVHVRTGPDELPRRAEVTLQTMIREWDDMRLKQALTHDLRELEQLRWRAAHALLPLIDDYRHTIATCLQTRGKNSTPTFTRRQARPTPSRAAMEAIQQLDALDARRNALRPGTATPVAAATPESAR